MIATPLSRVIGQAGLALSLILIPFVSLAGERRGGIEIGAKGVKATVVELGDGQSGPTVKTLMTEIANTTVSAGMSAEGRFAADAIRDTAAEAGKFTRKMREEFQVLPQNIKVIGSSGVPQASNRDELVKAVEDATGLEKMEFITPCREAELTIRGLVPELERGQVVLVDVGSGNTKGGLIGPHGQPICFSVPFGSVTYVNRVKKEAAGKPFPEAADGLREAALLAPLKVQVATQPLLTERPLVLLSGGAAYALVTLMHPESALKDRVTVTTQDIADYAKLVQKPVQTLMPKVDAITDPRTRETAEAEARNVLDNFTGENLIAGSQILLALADALKFEGKTLVFDRTGITAWIRESVSSPPLALNPGSAAAPRGEGPPTPASAPATTPAPSAPRVYPSPQSPPPSGK
jgi:hypothetical protein